MTPGDQLRFRGPAGAPFVVTVGAAFTADYVRARVDAGEWTPLEESAPEPAEPEQEADPEPEATPTASALRAWAKANDVPCPTKGKVPQSVVRAYMTRREAE